MKLKDWLRNDWQYSFNEKVVEKLIKREIVKEFAMSFSKPWASWREFATHKNVVSWVLLDSGHAVGFNENPSIGWSFPVKKLSKEQVEKYLAHNQTYEEYHGITEKEEDR